MTDTWIVGGAVRDELLGRPVRDVDVAVAGDPAPVARAIATRVGGPVFRLSETFGAWRVIDRRHDQIWDFSPLQGETIDEDLRKRDFSVNAMARYTTLPESLDVAAGELIDPLAGRADLDARILRVLGPQAYERDPLRPLRLARFAAELGFRADPETERLTAEAAPRTATAAGERIFAELRRLVIADGALEGLALADRLGLLAAVLPELNELHDVEQSHYHHLDVYDHTLEVLAQEIELEGRLEDVFGPEDAGRLGRILDEPLADELTRAQALRFGALLHDIGKPATRATRPDGRITFIGHDRLGERMIRSLCRRLRTSDRLARFLEGLTRHHLALGFLVHERPLDRRRVYRYLAHTSPVEVEVTLLSCADRLATGGRRAGEATEAHLELARELMRAALDWREHGPPGLPIRGDELARELGIEPGPELGRLLAELTEAAYAGEVATRDEAVAVARTLVA
ncbi:MAG TPA: HDIG domain-containing protein [Thermoleophilaceae bacterium]|nr:HDIG domain-containing protein [Thermoleophilaceae bacterium]